MKKQQEAEVVVEMCVVTCIGGVTRSDIIKNPIIASKDFQFLFYLFMYLVFEKRLELSPSSLRVGH